MANTTKIWVHSLGGWRFEEISKLRPLINLVSLLLIGSLVLGGCSTTNASQSSESAANVNRDALQSAIATKENTQMSNLPKLEGTAQVELKINGGTIIMELNGNDAPITAGNFVDLVAKNIYDGLVFHRVVKSPQPFVAQGGDPKGNGTGGYIDENGQKRQIPLEIKLEGDDEPTYSKAVGRQAGLSAPQVVLKHDRGAVAMARSQAPDSASSQFYIALADLEFLDGDYAVFGKVIEGMDVVDGIDQGDIIESAKVIQGVENLKN